MPLKSEFSVLNSSLFANIISDRNQIKCTWNGCWGLETSAVGSESSNSELVRPLINQINIGKDFKATKDFTMDINTINSFGGISGGYPAYPPDPRSSCVFFSKMRMTCIREYHCSTLQNSAPEFYTWLCWRNCGMDKRTLPSPPTTPSGGCWPPPPTGVFIF